MAHPSVIWIISLRNVLIFPIIDNQEVIYLFYYIQFFMQHVSIVLQHVLASTIKRKIVLVGDACSKPLITIKFHDLYASDIRRAVGEITSYHERD